MNSIGSDGMTFITALKYKYRVYGAMAGWYLVIYPITMILVSFVLMKTSVISEQQGSLIYRLGSSVIFLFAVFIRFKEDYDFLLTLSISRRDIFFAQIATTLGFSALFAFLTVVERVIIDHLNQMFGLQNIVDPFHFFSAYAVTDLFLQFIYFLALGFCCSLVGVLLGSLFYRFGKKFTLIFWLLFSAMPTIILPIYLWALYQRDELGQSMSALGAYLKTFDVLSASGTLLIITIIVGAATWMNMRRLPQN